MPENNTHIVTPYNPNAFGGTILTNEYDEYNIGRITFDSNIVVIGINAFYNCNNLTKIRIPYIITEIEENAFKNCVRLENIIIPITVTSIGRQAFYNCTALSNITFMGSIEQWNLIVKNSEWHVNVPATVVHCSDGDTDLLPDNEIWYKSSAKLTETTSTVTTYGVAGLHVNMFNTTIVNGGHTFSNGNGKIKFSDYVTTIKEYCFYQCTNMTSIEIPCSITTLKKSVFSQCTKLESIIIPNDVSSIGDCLFYNCSKLTTVNLPTSITSIPYQMFWGCKSLNQIVIPSNVTNIGNEAFMGCTSLTSITFDNTIAAWKRITKGTNWNSNVPTQVIHCTDGDYIPETPYSEIVYTASSKLTETTSTGRTAGLHINGFNVPVNSHTWSNNNGKITFNDYLTTISDYGFWSCTMNSITLPDTLTDLGAYTFSRCEKLTSINIPEGVTQLKRTLFYNCTSLQSIVLHKNITSIANECFTNCSALRTITIEATTPPQLEVSSAIPSTITSIYVPSISVNTYKTASNWSTFSSKIKAIQ